MEANERTQERAARRNVQTEAESADALIQGSIQEGLTVIGEIERLVGEAKQIPLTRSRVIKEDNFDDLMGQLHIVMPKMVREAKSVLSQRDELMDEASASAKAKREEADRYDRTRREEADKFDKQTRSDAENYRMQVMARAQEEANAIVEDAQTRARQIVEAAQQQAQHLIEESEITRRAQAYALEIRDDAQKQAANIYNQACHQTDLLLSGATASLSRSASDLAKLRDTLLNGGQQEKDQ